jgi:hypothetical protein
VEQKPAGGIPLVCVQTLRYRYEADARILQDSDVVQAVDQGPAEAVQLPHQNGVELPYHGIGH